jgi:hypothetical protein
MMKSVLALSLMLGTTTLSAQPVVGPAEAAHAQPTAACDRECLRGKITEVLHALVQDDLDQLDVAGNLRVTEDAVEKPLAQVGLLRSVTKLRGYRQDILDERAGQAVAGVMVEESGAPIILVVRIKVDGEQKLSEIELVATRSRADGMIYAIGAYDGAPTLGMNLVPRFEQLEPRDRAIDIAMHYPRGLSTAKTFNAVGTPFAEGAYRLENGALMAGPGCTIIPGCSDIGNQSLAIFQTLGRVTVRGMVVDERTGIVIMRLSWNRSGPGSDKLTAWEMFKVYDGKIHAVEAFMRVFPPEQDHGGWPIAPGITQP